MRQELIQEEKLEGQVPICAGNYSTPVEDVADYIDEIHFTIGGRKYIENADNLEDGPKITL